MSILDQIVDKARAAAAGDYGVLSSGEKLAAALVLNRADWLQLEGYTIAEAIDRLGPQWVAALPAAAKQLKREIEVVQEQLAKASAEEKEVSFFSSIDLHLSSRLVTVGHSSGYRDATLFLDVEPLNYAADRPHGRKARIELQIQCGDAESIVRHLHEVHSSAWKLGRRPIDATDGEVRPSWLDRL